MNQYIFSQVGPLPPTDEIVVAEPREYPKDSYEVHRGGGKSFPWFWFFFVLVTLAGVVYAFLKVRDKLKRRDRNEKAKEWNLFEVRVPRGNETEIGVAEKMFSNLIGIGGKGKGLVEGFTVNNSVSFEIVALPGEIKFFVYCPKKLGDSVEKQILGSYQDADVRKVDDYSIFEKSSKVVFTRLILEEESYCPIKVTEDFTGDPTANILSTLSKMSEGEGAIIQVVITPTGSEWQKNGMGFVKKVENNNADPEKKKINVSQEKLQAISKKVSKTGFVTDIRIVTSAQEEALAEMHLENIVSAFDQYSNPGINKFKKVEIKGKKKEEEFMYDVVYRRTPLDTKSILNVEELAAIYHFPNKEITTPNINWLLAREIPASKEVNSDINSKDTIWVGNNVFRGKRKAVCFQREDRRRHAYILGQTGTGKSWLMTRMIIQDIFNGDGVCFIDPHGQTADMILERIPPERAEDVIYFNAADFERPFGLNIMEFYNEQHKHQIVNSFIALLIKMFDPHNQGYTGPAFQQAVRNSMLTAMSAEGSTLIEVVRMLQDEQWVHDKWLPIVKDELVRRYWIDQVAKTDQKTKSESLTYFISKFDKFTTNLAIRNIIGQSESSFDFRDVMDTGKILIVNLAKGMLGEENMSFLGLILVQKMLAAALSREDVGEEERKDFFMYVDEFQNFTTDEFASILSEARKYKLNLTVAHQYIGQLPENIKGAVFGNVGSFFVTRCSSEDAVFLEPQFETYVKSVDIINQGMAQYYVRMLTNGSYPSPFSLDARYGSKYPENGFDMKSSVEVANIIKKMSRLKYGRDVNIVNIDINKRAELGRKEESKPETSINFPPIGF
ncbi:DUF87 domain-containing protein [Candidatus Dojkabacteria bacterium]|uniref:DUF87 domain-containing protein n=1 Tax=Candidatus Dojkabacteria bacterium TaxID=2099670 RepID=A0A847VCI5_9BACT|nr:DUF87 domain-containing protein [Candidatus Dojkabacteria bacterium]